MCIRRRRKPDRRPRVIRNSTFEDNLRFGLRDKFGNPCPTDAPLNRWGSDTGCSSRRCLPERAHVNGRRDRLNKG